MQFVKTAKNAGILKENEIKAAAAGFLKAKAETTYSSTITDGFTDLAQQTADLSSSFVSLADAVGKLEIAGQAVDLPLSLTTALAQAGQALKDAGVYVKAFTQETHIQAAELPAMTVTLELEFDAENPEVAHALSTVYAWANPESLKKY